MAHFPVLCIRYWYTCSMLYIELITFKDTFTLLTLDNDWMSYLYMKIEPSSFNNIRIDFIYSESLYSSYPMQGVPEKKMEQFWSLKLHRNCNIAQHITFGTHYVPAFQKRIPDLEYWNSWIKRLIKSNIVGKSAKWEKNLWINTLTLILNNLGLG